MKRRRTKDPQGEKETEVVAAQVACCEVAPHVIAGSSLVFHRALVSPNGKWLLCICGPEVRIYSCSSGDLQSVLQESPDTLASLAFNATSPHSQIYSVTRNGRLVVWNYEEGIAVKAYDLKSPTFGVYSPNRNGAIFVLLKTHSKSPEASEKVQEIGGVDTSCSLFQISSLDGLSRKKGLRSIMRDLSNDCHKVAFDPQGDFLAVITDNALCLYFFKLQQYKKHLVLGRQFTCIAIHPRERCIATGDDEGRILLWRCFEEHSGVTKSIMHWHSASVLDLAFSAEGSYLWSGGWESTLVQWSLNQTDDKDFIPRMGAAIAHLSISYDNNIIVVSHADGVITLVGLQRNILCTVSSLYWPSNSSTSQQFDELGRDVRAVLAMEPISKSLVLRGKPGQLQIYNPSKDKLFSPIDIVGQNIMSSGLNNFTNAKIDAVAFGAGSHRWMCTADSLFTKHVGSIINLKFWQFDEFAKRYILKTSVVDPHDSNAVRWIVFGPSSDHGIVATLSDNNFKIWMAIEEKTLNGARLVWCCIGQGQFGDHQPLALVFSSDGTTLAVAFGHLVTFWDVETVSLRDTALVNPHTLGLIRNISYGAEKTDIFLVATDGNVSFWNLSSMRLVNTLVTRASFLSCDPEHSLYAICGSDSVTVLDGRTTDLLYHYTFPTDPVIISCLIVPREEAEIDGDSSPKWLSRYRLFLLSAKGELWIVDDKGSKAHSKAKKLYAIEDEQLSPYAHLKATALVDTTMTDDFRNGMGNDRRESFVCQLLSVPAYTLPKAEYFLTEHLNSLLGIPESKSIVQEEEEMDVDSDWETPGQLDEISDEEDIDETVRPARNSKIVSPVEYEDEKNLDHNYSFLRASVKLMQPVPTGRKKMSIDCNASIYSKMSQLYQEIRSD